VERRKKQDHEKDPKTHQGQDEAWTEPVTSVEDLEASAPALVLEAFASAFETEASAFDGIQGKGKGVID